MDSEGAGQGEGGEQRGVVELVQLAEADVPGRLERFVHAGISAYRSGRVDDELPDDDPESTSV